MGKIREPWASGFGYGGLAKRIYCRTGPRFGRSHMEYTPKSLARGKAKREGAGGMTDPIDRIVLLVSLRLAKGSGKDETLEQITQDCRAGIEAEFVQWATAHEEIRLLEKPAKR